MGSNTTKQPLQQSDTIQWNNIKTSLVSSSLKPIELDSGINELLESINYHSKVNKVTSNKYKNYNKQLLSETSANDTSPFITSDKYNTLYNLSNNKHYNAVIGGGRKAKAKKVQSPKKLEGFNEKDESDERKQTSMSDRTSVSNPSNHLSKPFKKINHKYDSNDSSNHSSNISSNHSNNHSNKKSHKKNIKEKHLSLDDKQKHKKELKKEAMLRQLSQTKK